MAVIQYGHTDVHEMEPSTRHSCMRKVPWGIQDRPSGPVPIKSGCLSLPLYKNRFPGTTRYSIQISIPPPPPPPFFPLKNTNTVLPLPLKYWKCCYSHFKVFKQNVLVTLPFLLNEGTLYYEWHTRYFLRTSLSGLTGQHMEWNHSTCFVSL